MRLKFETLPQGDTYSEKDLEQDFLHVLQALLWASDPDGKEHALARLSAFLRMASSKDLFVLKLVPEIISEYFEQKRSPERIQNLFIDLTRHPDADIREFAYQSLLLTIYEYHDIGKIGGIRDKFLSPLISSLADPVERLRSWVACSLCYLTDHTFSDLPSLQQYTQNLPETDSPFWNKYILHARILNLETQDKAKPVRWKEIESVLQTTVISGSDTDKTDIRKRQLQLIRSHYARHQDSISSLIFDFVLQQCQVPELKDMAVSTCFIIFIKVQVIWYEHKLFTNAVKAPGVGGGSNLTAILDIVYQYMTQINAKNNFLNDRYGFMMSLLPVQFGKPEESIAKALAGIFESTLKYQQFEDAIKILFLLFETEKFMDKASIESQKCMHLFLSKLQEIIEIRCSKNRPLSSMHHLMIDLLQYRPRPEIRLFAAEAILTAVYESYCLQFFDVAYQYPLIDLQTLFLPVLVQQMNDPNLEVRKRVACSLSFLDTAGLVDPQLLVSYTEALLNADNPAWQTRSILALTRLVNQHQCFLSQPAVSRLVHLGFKSDILSHYILRYRFRNQILCLLNLQVEYTGMPLPAEVIEQCLDFDPEKCVPSNYQLPLKGNLLNLITINFETQEAVQSIPASISDVILDYFDEAGLRKLAWHAYTVIIEASGKKLYPELFNKLFSKLREFAQSSNPELHGFVQKILRRITGLEVKKQEILGLIGKAEQPEQVFSETAVYAKPSDEKDLEALLAELCELNGNNPNVSRLLTSHDLVNSLAAVKAVYANDSCFLPAGMPIEAWGVTHCKAWARALIQNKAKALARDFQTEMVAVIMRASVLDSGQTPRNIQLISLLILLKAEEGGCLAEVKTGEGKTKIVSMFAAFKALQLDYVDVVSSSTILARRDAHEMQNFFSILSLTVADNIDGKDHHGKAPRACYSANVVYGDTNEYQWDIVREAMGEWITRGNRPNRILFFDEVDSLLVDRAEYGAMILKPHPALEYVNHVIVAVWHMMVRMGQSIIGKDGQWVYTSVDGKDEVIIGNLRSFVQKLLEKYILQLVNDPDSSILLPKHLKNFVLAEVEQFTDSAFCAYYIHQPDKHYVITEYERSGENQQRITIVDTHLTGEILKNTRWTYLHSFLELKHGLKMGPPQLMGNYLSTPGLCRRYGNQIFGLTGTLGGTDTQTLLKEMYQVDLAFIPTYKPKCFIEHDGIVAPTKSAWLGEIIHSVREKVQRGVPVLIVTATIADVIFLEKTLLEAKACTRVTRFSRNDTEEMDTPSHAIEAGEVIIATLIAGRGIDWYFARQHNDLIEAQGGLHIMVTSLPLNLRVEQQIFGRTARKGNRGSAQLVINREDIQRRFRAADSAYFDTIPAIRVLRDKVEAKRVYRIRTQGIRLALLKDDLYLRFRGFINSLKGRDGATHRIGGIEEQWAYWLQNVAKKLEEDYNPDITLQLMEAKFHEFIETIRHQDVIRANPCRQVQQGNLLSCSKRRFSDAIEVYTKAIHDDPLVGVQAYYNRAEARIFQKGGNYADEVLADLQMAKANLEKHIIPQLHSMFVVQSLNPATTNAFNSDFARQTHCKIELLKLEIANIDQNISIIHQARHQARKAKQKVDFEVCELKNLMDFFPDPNTRPVSEIRELHSSGLAHLFSIQPFFREKKKKGFGAICVAFLGIIQIVVGVLVSYAAPMIGSMLIQEGINDIMHAARALISGNFDWNAYLANKVGSVSIHVISMGLEILKNSANLGMAAEAAKGQNALKTLMARQLNHEKLLELAKNEVVKRVVDAGVREVFNFAVDKLSTVAIDRFSGDIERAIGKRLEETLSSPDCQSALDGMLQLDASHQNTAMRGQLERMASKIMQEKSSLTHTIANHIIKGVLANQHSSVRTFLRIADMGVALDKILHLTEHFARQFRAELLYFYHQQVAHLPGTSVDQTVIAPLKHQLLATITKSLTQRIIATAKGEIIHPGIDMAMSEHLDNVANLIKKAALQPVPPEHMAAATEQAPKSLSKKNSGAASSSSFGQYVQERRDAVRRAEFREAFGKTVTVTAPTEARPARYPAVPKGRSAPEKTVTPAQAGNYADSGTEMITRMDPCHREDDKRSVCGVAKVSRLPEILTEDVETVERQMWRRMNRLSSPLNSFISDLYGQFKSHDSGAQYILDAMRMYPPMRYLEGAALIGEYSKEHGLAKKAIQTWTTKLKARDPFADDYYRAASTLVLLEHLATGLNMGKEYIAAQCQERIDQLKLVWKFLMLKAASPGFIDFMPLHPEERSIRSPASSSMESGHPARDAQSRHRFFIQEQSKTRRNEALPEQGMNP
ncbi:preprotein translocase, secretion protein SecA subunit [Legionella geestiana]|uniref:Preprotein translocase, secretion protein SecA subunit n=1 Tax=Legionella geestiana TaxID=45065 RepID=A0A0W0TJV4_9GAMM|nr:hypothetical protein [Legionella geestiana]KTC95848.1 preprotein translocase, secretion protein SecA subunit [Legionella geestiana]QBS13260.1 hypothetical protein E4T54_11180 [Legionella geestiana]STX54214.1 preprotein translocase, secretion protein SecA subunit [Legionella geestiana]